MNPLGGDRVGQRRQLIYYLCGSSSIRAAAHRHKVLVYMCCGWHRGGFRYGNQFVISLDHNIMQFNICSMHPAQGSDYSPEHSALVSSLVPGFAVSADQVKQMSYL